MLNIKKFNTGLYGVNTYILTDSETKDTVIIDWGGDFDMVNEYLEQNNLKLNYILNTHGHFDHIMADDEAQKKLGVPVYAHQDDLELINFLPEQLKMFGEMPVDAPQIDNYVEDGDILEFGSYKIKVFHTPGHSQGGVSYLIEDNLFSGDTLFYECVGRTDFPYANTQQLLNSIRTKLYTLKDDIKVFPGHGDATTIGHEKEYNEFV